MDTLLVLILKLKKQSALQESFVIVTAKFLFKKG